MKSNVLFIDIETAPVIGAVWGLWKQNLGLDMIKEDWYIMSYSAKWLGENEVIYEDCRDNLEDDYLLCESIHSLFDEADVIIAHNGDKFDIKKINTRLILNGFSPPSSYQTIDTLKIAKAHFNFTSNKLAFLTDQLCTHKKLDHAKYAGFKLWKECLQGNEEAWEEMRVYNEMDVISLEELYLKLRPWYSSHPVLSTFEDESDKHICPKCGGTHVVRRGYYTTKTGNRYQRYRCSSCGGWSRSRFTETTRERRESMPTSI